MTVTDIKEMSRSRYRVFLDGEFAFVLYRGELRLYGLKTGEPVSTSTVEEIVQVLLPKRAKKRSLALLLKKDYTEWELRRKLQDGEYPQNAIDEAIEYVRSYHYIDDVRYCRAYINCHASEWSRQQILSKLSAKGIDKHLTQSLYEELSDAGELNCEEDTLIYRILEKKHFDPQKDDPKQREKLYRHLLYKGFSMDQIRHAMEKYGRREDGRGI